VTFFWSTHTSARSRGTSKRWARRAPARTGLTSQEHRSDRWLQRCGESLRSPPREGPLGGGAPRVALRSARPLNVPGRRRDKQGKHKVWKARGWETKIVKSNDLLGDRSSTGRGPLRTMCGSRTCGWSFPCVMSDWQCCVDWFLAKYCRCRLRLDWCWCRWRTSAKGRHRWGLQVWRRQVGFVCGTRWPAGSSAGRMMAWTTR
jgi:hypothetical protein